MQIVIDIPKVMFINAKSDLLFGADILVNAIKNGTPLPKGHGRLIDEKEVYKKFYCRCLAKVAKEVLDETSTIIEADTDGAVVEKMAESEG